MKRWLSEHGSQIVVGLIVAALAGLGGLIVRAILDDDDSDAEPTPTTPAPVTTTSEPDSATATSSAPESSSTVPGTDPTTTSSSTTTSAPTTTSTTTTTTTTIPPTFLEQLVGSWTLMDWRERPPDPVTLGMDALTGTLVVDWFGNSYWELELDDGGPTPQFTPGVRCMGVFDQVDVEMDGVPGRLVVDGEDLIGETRDWTSNLLSLRADASVAFCGWTFEPESNLFVYESTTSAYALDLSTVADEARTPLLTMRNEAGTFTWLKDDQ